MFALIWDKENDEQKKGVEKYKKYIQFLPLLSGIGAVWQSLALLQYNALYLFSWTQVINDTAILMVPFSVIFVGFYWGTNDKYMKYNVWITLLQIFFTSVGALIVLCLLQATGYDIQKINLNIYFSFLGLFCLGIALVYYVELMKKNSSAVPVKNHFMRNFFRPILILPLFLLIIVTTIPGLLKLYGIFSSGIQVQLHGEKISQKIQYINDKYIIYDNGKIVVNDPEYATLVKSGE